MNLNDMICTLRHPQVVEIRDKEGYEQFTCISTSKALVPFLGCEVTEWFSGAAPFKHCDFTVYIDIKE